MGKKVEILKSLRELLGEGAARVDEAYRAGVAFSAQAPVEKLRDAASACKQCGFYLESVACLDFQDTAELVYHLNCYEPKSRFTLRVLIGHDGAAPTVSDIFASAMWQEREVCEFFGIRFSDHPDLRPLLLPEDADYHPLRKTFGKVHAYRKREEIYG
jgi:NADH-quinone oxidoreductase subunit C